MKELAVKYFLSGYSCSESIVQAAVDKGYVKQDLLQVASAFSGGMGVRCLCGAVAGSQLVISSIYGKIQGKQDGMQARKLAKVFNEKFAQTYKVNCCKVLSAGFDFSSQERKQNCTKLVSFCATILEEILKEEMVEVK